MRKKSHVPSVNLTWVRADGLAFREEAAMKTSLVIPRVALMLALGAVFQAHPAEHAIRGTGAIAGITAAPGVAYTVFATNLSVPRGLLANQDGSLSVAEEGAGRVVRITADGRVVEIAGGLDGPHDLESDAQGNLYVAETGKNRIARIAPNGTVTSYIDDLNAPVDLAFSPQGELFVCEFTGERLIAFKSPTEKRVVISGFRPHGLAFPMTGGIIVNDISGSRVIKILADGKVDLIADKIDLPIGIVIGPSGDLYLAARKAGQLLRISRNGTRTVLLSGLKTPRDPAFDAKGNLYVAESDGGRILKVTGRF